MKKLTLVSHKRAGYSSCDCILNISGIYLQRRDRQSKTKSERGLVEGGGGLIGDTRAASPSLIAPPPPLHIEASLVWERLGFGGGMFYKSPDLTLFWTNVI